MADKPIIVEEKEEVPGLYQYDPNASGTPRFTVMVNEPQATTSLTDSARLNEAGLKIDQVILTPEVVDDFRKHFDNPSEALARDLVRTMQLDYPEQMAADPTFLTYDGLIGGTAPFFRFVALLTR